MTTVQRDEIAKKAAGEILDAISVHDDLRLIAKETNRDDCVALFSPIIQQSITEAVDAATSPLKEEIRMLSNAQEGACAKAVATERAFWQKRIAELESNGTEEK